MNFALVGHVQSVRFLQRPLFMREDVYVTLDTFLAHIGPAVARHPFAFTLWAFVLSEATFLPLVRRQTLALRPSLWTIFDVVTFVEAEVAKITGRRSFRRLPVQQAEIRETIRKIVADVLRETTRYPGGGAERLNPLQIAVRPGCWKSVPDTRQQFALIRRRDIVIGDREIDPIEQMRRVVGPLDRLLSRISDEVVNRSKTELDRFLKLVQLLNRRLRMASGHT